MKTIFYKALIVQLLILFFGQETLFAQCNITGGVVLDDGELIGQLDGEDHLQTQVRVHLFRDRDCNGLVNSGDVLIDTENTERTGLFTFANLYQAGPSETFQDSITVFNNDDAEEEIQNGFVDLNSSNLDFGNEWGFDDDQIVGIRFVDLGIPFGATINSAYIKFNAKQNGIGSTIQHIVAEATVQADPIVAGFAAYSLSERLEENPSTSIIEWSLQASDWPINEYVQTPDLSQVVQELVNIPGWKTNSPMMLFFMDPNDAQGTFRAVSGANSNQDLHPELFVSWATPEETSNCYIIEPDLNDFPQNAVFVNGSSSIAVDLSENDYSGGFCSTNNFIAYNGSASSCYAVAERPNELRIFNRFSGNWSTIGNHGIQQAPPPVSEVEEIETIAMDDAGNIFTINVHEDGLGYFGSLDPLTGVFSPVGPSIGTGEDANGNPIVFTDVDALTYNPETGYFWGMQTERIIKIDPATGMILPNAFNAPGKDYINITGLPNGVVDDLAIDPTTGILYGITDNGSAQSDHSLVTIDTETAQANFVAQFQTETGTLVKDFNGIAFAEDGQLYGVTGEEATFFRDRAFKINKESGLVELLATFTQFNSDMEGCACRKGLNVDSTNPDDIGIEFDGNGLELPINSCEDFVLEVFTECESDNSSFQVILAFEGGNSGQNGYNIVDNFTGETFENLSENVFTISGNLNGSGFSYSVYPADHPECILLVEANMIDCISTEIQLITFEGVALNDGNLLSWSTASEIDHAYFDLESSYDGNKFESIQTVLSNGDSNVKSDYQYFDKRLLGELYYRLVSTDRYSKKTYSNIVLVNRNNSIDYDFLVSPSIVEERIKISPISNDYSIEEIFLADINGRVLTKEKYLDRMGNSGLDLSHFDSGVYLIIAKINNQYVVKKIVKN